MARRFFLLLGLPFDPENGDNVFFSKAGKLQPDYTAYHLRRQYYS
jgi:hypothetical protein